jgi:EmrB/QacA subfamily drug resistance transporter
MKYKWIVLSNTTIGTLMASLDTNIIIVALPVIASELHTSLLTTLWTALGYWLVTASVLLNFGRLADIFGRVRLYNLGFAIFTVGSALSSISQTGEQLVMFRIIQAFGAAFLFSNSAAILTDVFPENERGKALGLNQVAIVLGSVLGLVFGGFLTSYLGWRSVFWINIPIGMIGTVWSYTKLKELGTIRKGDKIDWLGNVTFAAGLFILLAGITFTSSGIISSNSIQFYLAIVGGISLLVLFVFIEKHISKDYPMFHFSLFKVRAFVGGNIATLLNSIARGDFTLIMAFYLQGPSMKLSPLEAGIYLIPVSGALAICGPISGWLSDRYGSRVISSIGLILSAIGFLMLMKLEATASFIDLLSPLLLIGAGMGVFASPNRASIMNSVKSFSRGVAAGTSTTLILIGRTLSLGIAFLIMAGIMPIQQIKTIILGDTAATLAITTTTSAATSATTQLIIGKFLISMHMIFLISAIFMLVAILPVMIKNKIIISN